jgi:hypothetical protein
MRWAQHQLETTDLDSLVSLPQKMLTVEGGSSTLSFMEGIRAALSSSAQVSPADTATPQSRHPRPRRRSTSHRIPADDVDALIPPPRRIADHRVNSTSKTSTHSTPGSTNRPSENNTKDCRSHHPALPKTTTSSTCSCAGMSI